MYIEYHIENHRVGLTHKFFFRSQEIGLPSPGSDMFGFEHPDAPPGFYTVPLARIQNAADPAHVEAVAGGVS